MPPPYSDLTLSIDGVPMPVQDIVVREVNERAGGVYVTSTGPWSRSADDESLRDTILRLATGRPCTHEVIYSICAALERRLQTRVRLSVHQDRGDTVYGIGRSPIGYTRGRDSEVEITIDLATVDQLREVQDALREIVPVGVVVEVRAGDGRTADREEWHDEYARRAYGIERREPAPRTYDLGDGLTLNLSSSTYVGPGKVDDIKVELRVPGRTVWDFLLEDDPLEDEAA